MGYADPPYKHYMSKSVYRELQKKRCYASKADFAELVRKRYYGSRFEFKKVFPKYKLPKVGAEELNQL